MSKIFKSFSLFMVIVILLSSIYSVNVLSASITTAYISGTNVRVREKPTTQNSAILDELSTTTVPVINKVQNGNDTWLQVSYTKADGRNISGYVFYDSSYIRIVEYNPDADFETKIQAFPETYRPALRELHSIYPNWNFMPDPVAATFTDAVNAQSVNMRKQVNFNSQPVSWRSMGLGSYDWTTNKWATTNGGWTGASREIISYYMDPRNFLNPSSIYMFLQESYDQNLHTEDGVRIIASGTFLANGYSDPEDTAFSGDYAKVIMEAARQSGVNPYVLASKIRQEIGINGTSSLVSGTTEHGKFFNFFNIGASGANDAQVIANGLNYAKASGWNTRSAAIIGGAKFLANNYISAGQDTLFYQDFNVHNPDKLWHQYAQAVHDAYNKGVKLADIYKTAYDFPLTFKIPVYSAMPSTAFLKPVSNSTCNNYYISNMSVSGLTPSFSMYNYHYSLAINSNTAINLTTVPGATLASGAEYKLNPGPNTVVISVKSESGYNNDYTIYVNATTACTLYITNDGKLPDGVTTTPSYRKGDTNGDNAIDLADLANVRLHILGLYNLTNGFDTSSDTNNDGSINLADLANIRLHILGLYSIPN